MDLAAAVFFFFLWGNEFCQYKQKGQGFQTEEGRLGKTVFRKNVDVPSLEMFQARVDGI